MVNTHIDLEKLNSEFGEGNWKIRQVSINKKHKNIPVLTISSELMKIGVNAKDYVIIAVKNNTIIIRKLI